MAQYPCGSTGNSTTTSTQLALLERPDRTVAPGPEPDLTAYDLIVVGLSGKDAHAALDTITAQARAAGAFGRVLTVHADLGLMENPGVHFDGRYYPGNRELVAQQSAAYGVLRCPRSSGLRTP